MNLGTEPNPGMSAERAMRWAMLSSLRVLRQSVHHRRPMSLPNLLRLFRRRVAMAELSPTNETARVEQGLLEWYRQHQPFRQGAIGIGMI